jgi:hypothetical protein
VQLVTYSTALAHGQTWAGKSESMLNMQSVKDAIQCVGFSVFDSDSQTPPGLAGAKVSWSGAYEQCVAVKPTYSNVPVAPGIVLYHDFSAQYCRSFYVADNVISGMK